MAKTSALIELEYRVKEIELNLLPIINPLGFYTDSEQDLIRAYVLLCHAEIEHYIEDLARLLSSTIRLELKNKKRGNKFSRFYAQKVSKDIDDVINKNHGLKENNLKNIFGPFGIDESDFDLIDSKFVTQMNAFGSRRGESAHCSAKRAKQQPNPIKEKKAVEDILKYLENFETELNKIRLAGFL